jgi:hypothetical protein
LHSDVGGFHVHLPVCVPQSPDLVCHNLNSRLSFFLFHVLSFPDPPPGRLFVLQSFLKNGGSTMGTVLKSITEYISVAAFLLSLISLLWQWSLRWTRIKCSDAVIVPAPAGSFTLVVTLTNKSSVSLSVHSAKLVINDMHLKSIFYRDSVTWKDKSVYLNSPLPFALPGYTSMRVALKLVHDSPPSQPLPPLSPDNQTGLPATLTLYTSRRNKILSLNLSLKDREEWIRGTAYSGGF